ncbi:hypothetical protein JW758_06035 [Candidatus Peregrinibacteria bacterium]|nr:hypothetical protein [Candidatus Peregrinibacteria bacterium]
MPKVPKITVNNGESDRSSESNNTLDCENTVSETRCSVSKIEDNEHYALGKEFDFDEESRNGNILPKAVDFLKGCDIARKILADLYEYDMYSYIHTVQMLNLGCSLIESHSKELKNVLMITENKRGNSWMDLAFDDYKETFLGAIVMHDYGKIKVERKLINTGKFVGGQYKRMQKHAIETVNIITDEVVGKVTDDLSNESKKKVISKILNSDDYPEQKRLLKMLYMASRHHINKGYPSVQELNMVLPDYELWLESTGNEQGSILAIMDIFDARRSTRSYKEEHDEDDIKFDLNEEFKNIAEEQDFFREFIDCISSKTWVKMNGSNDYEVHREAMDRKYPNNGK